MKALLLLPLHESSEHIAMQLMVAFSKKGIEALSVPSYADYLKSVHLAQNFESSVIMALVTAKEFAQEHDDCVIIGNCDTSIKFDVILNVNIHHEEGEAIQDLQIAKLQELYGADPDLGPILNHLYTTQSGEYSAGGSVDQIVELALNLCQAKLN